MLDPSSAPGAFTDEAAVRLTLANGGTEAWALAGASLTPQEGIPLAEVGMLPGTLIPAVAPKEIDILVRPTPRHLKGTYTLKLWGGGRDATVEGLNLPAL